MRSMGVSYSWSGGLRPVETVKAISLNQADAGPIVGSRKSC